MPFCNKNTRFKIVVVEASQEIQLKFVKCSVYRSLIARGCWLKIHVAPSSSSFERKDWVNKIRVEYVDP
jgi:hypothetical protein